MENLVADSLENLHDSDQRRNKRTLHDHMQKTRVKQVCVLGLLSHVAEKLKELSTN